MGSLLEHNDSTKFVGIKLNKFDFFDFWTTISIALVAEAGEGGDLSWVIILRGVLLLFLLRLPPILPLLLLPPILPLLPPGPPILPLLLPPHPILPLLVPPHPILPFLFPSPLLPPPSRPPLMAYSFISVTLQKILVLRVLGNHPMQKYLHLQASGPFVNTVYYPTVPIQRIYQFT